jgi:hypothetical protein
VEQRLAGSGGLLESLLVCEHRFSVVQQLGGDDHEHDAVSTDRGCAFVGEVLLESSVDRLSSWPRDVELIEEAGVVGIGIVADNRQIRARSRFRARVTEWAYTRFCPPRLSLA